MNAKRQKGDAEVFGLILLAWIAASWLTHVVVCLGAAKWGFLIAGAILFPIAVIHGTGIWFGAF
jgi:hypothetical protein